LLQTQLVEIVLDSIGQGLNRGRSLWIQWRAAAVAGQRQRDHVMVGFEMWQHWRPDPPDGADAV
jgi:hypothetical protein